MIAVRKSRRIMFFVLVLTLMTSFAAQAYVDKLEDIGSVRFQNNWGTTPEREWHQARDLYQAGQHEQLVRLFHWMLSTGEFDEMLVRRNLAVVLKDLGDIEGAIEQYEILVSRVSDPKDHLDLGWALLQAGRFGESLDVFQSVVQRSPEEPWAYYGLGRTFAALGQLGQAVDSFEHAIRLDDSLAPVHYHLGLIQDDLGNYTGARSAYDRALRLDPSYTELYIRLARLHDAAGNIELAWRYYRGAALRYPQDQEANEAVQRLSVQHEKLLKGIEQAENVARLAAVRHRTVDIPPNEAGVPMVRVGLAENEPEVRFTSGGVFRILDMTGKELARGEANDVWRAQVSAQGVRLIDSDGTVRGEATSGMQIVQVDPTQTFILYDMVFGRGYYFAAIEHRQYRGDLEIIPRSSGLTVVNKVSLEAYLYSVVPSEMYASMPLEALKVQAMAARTYTLRNMGRYASRGFDVLGSVASSEYRGVDREHANTTRAVDETRGLVLHHDGRLIEALYSATSGGHSASSAEVWGGQNPYLQGRLDSSDPQAPDFPLTPAALDGWVRGLPRVYASTANFGIRSTFRWIHPLTASRLQQIIDGRTDIGRIVKIIPRERSVGGHVSRVEIVGTDGTYEVTGDRIRSTLGGIKSNLFRIETLLGPDGFPTEFLIIGGGSGHSVGLSQLGAAGRAREGQSAEEIVSQYYGNVAIHQEY